MTADAIGDAVETDKQKLGVRGASLGLACAIGVTLFALLLLLPATAGKGPEMDEGAVLAYSARVLDGAVPHRDFLTFYGPGGPWLVAGAFKVFGMSIGVERGVGLLYRLVIVLSLFALARRVGGLLAGVLAGIVSVTIMAPETIWAYAEYGAIAFGLLGLALSAAGAEAGPGRRRLLFLLAAGLAGGVATLIRFDFAPAVAVAALPFLVVVAARGRIWYGAGFLAAAGAYLVHLTIVGPEKVGRVLADLIASGPGRALPLPRPWDPPGHLLWASFLLTAVLVFLGIALWRRDPLDIAGRVLLASGLFNAAMIPLTISRANWVHVRPLTLVPVSLLPAVVLLLTRSPRVAARGRAAVSVFVAAATLLVVIDDDQLTIDRVRSLRAVGGASRWLSSDESHQSASAVTARARRLARPGDSLFVGPQDLRRTNYGPTYMYFLLPQLRPASYYMEMNPMTANREGSGFADELRRADWLILTSEWDDWKEPNESSKFGSAEPNDVVRAAFCLRFESGEYRLYERCRRL